MWRSTVAGGRPHTNPVTGRPVSLEKANHRKRWDAKQPAYGESHGGGVTERRNEMFYTFQIMVLETWDLWCGLFKPLPYGDPYIATFILVVLLAISVKMVAGGEPA